MLLNRIVAGFLILIFCCQLFDRNIITLSFYANQKYITASLCENRNKPQLHCEGKCQLQKKLNQQDNKDKQNPERKNENHTQVISSKTFFAQLNLPLHTSIKKQFSTASAATAVDQAFQFFRPPQFCM